MLQYLSIKNPTESSEKLCGFFQTSKMSVYAKAHQRIKKKIISPSRITVPFNVSSFAQVF